ANRSHSKYDKIFNSYFATFSYNYDEKYYLDLTYRRDGSSLFGLNSQWGNFWSAGAMWDLKKENFLSDISWLNQLQLKASYGSVGNSSGLDPYMSFGLIGTGPLYGGQSGTAVANPANPDLTWEVVKSTNVGLSTRLFDRVSLDIEFYNRMTENMLMEIPYSFTTGFASGWGNVANMRNRGVDITANVDVLRDVNGFDWTISANVNYNKNEITQLFNGLDEYVLANTGLKLEVGKPYGEYYYTRWAGVDPRDGYNTWYDKNGNLTKTYSADDAVFLGKQRYAPWSGGFGTRLAWKGITVSADFSFMLGQYMVNNERWFTENPQMANSRNQTTEMLTMWQKPGDITNISTPDSPMQFDSHLLENASFMRLKNLTVSYTMMNVIKVTLGFLELAFALKFLSVADLAYGWRILDRETFLALWIVLFALLGFYLLGKIKFPHDDDDTKVGVGRFFMALFSLAFAVYMVPGLWGAPLKAVSAFAPPMQTQDFNLYNNEVHAKFDDYDLGMEYARQHGKPVMLDFTGYGCVNCRKMELAVWTDSKVSDIINNDYVLITLYVDNKTPLTSPVKVTENGRERTLRTVGDKWSYLQRVKFGANAQPFYVLIDNEGRPLNKSYSYDEDIPKYIEFLQTGLENYKKGK
ncbi:thioredoxin family protein, partial [Bacteroides intestinalis]|uniref:thioredoxin family protein n=1 Tax=Bacteroides intestinalis TaxID=329854 RepID=UPI000AA24337